MPSRKNRLPSEAGQDQKPHELFASFVLQDFLRRKRERLPVRLDNGSNKIIPLPHQQRQAFQSIVFPNGIPFDGKELGTAETAPVFKVLQGFEATENQMATLSGIEPELPP